MRANVICISLTASILDEAKPSYFRIFSLANQMKTNNSESTKPNIRNTMKKKNEMPEKYLEMVNFSIHFFIHIRRTNEISIEIICSFFFVFFLVVAFVNPWKFIGRSVIESTEMIAQCRT